jgi:hypothetical protein
MGRISGLNGSSPLTNYYQLPYPDEDGQELTGVAAGGGYVWSADWEYGEIDAFQYGAPSSATMTLSMQRHTMATISAPKNPAVRTLVHAHYGRTIRSTHAK